MSRQDALLRLHKSLTTKRDEIRRQLAEDLTLTATGQEGGGDVVDTAMGFAQNELHSQLAAFESRELLQIERAIELLRTGRYGSCEVCQEKIPIARLKALPYTTHCIRCQQKQELRGRRAGFGADDWSSAYESEGRERDGDLTISDISIPLE